MPSAPPVTYTVNDLMTMKADALQKMSRQDMLSASLTVTYSKRRRLNPLNTDHTANLGRLYRFWGEVGGSEACCRRRWTTTARL